MRQECTGSKTFTIVHKMYYAIYACNQYWLKKTRFDNNRAKLKQIRDRLRNFFFFFQAFPKLALWFWNLAIGYSGGQVCVSWCIWESFLCFLADGESGAVAARRWEGQKNLEHELAASLLGNLLVKQDCGRFSCVTSGCQFWWFFHIRSKNLEFEVAAGLGTFFLRLRFKKVSECFHVYNATRGESCGNLKALIHVCGGQAPEGKGWH